MSASCLAVTDSSSSPPDDVNAATASAGATDVRAATAAMDDKSCLTSTSLLATSLASCWLAVVWGSVMVVQRVVVGGTFFGEGGSANTLFLVIMDTCVHYSFKNSLFFSH